MPTRNQARSKTLRPEDIARVVIRPVGTVLPLGFLVFATGAFVTATYSIDADLADNVARLESEPGVRTRL
jgi:hypothetical protein